MAITKKRGKKMNILVFDTETAGCKTQSLLNVGYTIVDLNLSDFSYRTLVKRDYLMRDVYKNVMWLLNDMFVGEEKLTTLQYNEAHKGAIVRTEKQVFEQLARDLARHKVEVGYAYNCQFDTDKFAKTAIAYGLENPLENIKVFDLWGYAYWKICVTEEYQAFCREHNLKTKSGKYFPTSVEGVTAFLNDEPEFKEEHTALSDVYWELRILIECAKRGQNILEYVTRGGWIALDGSIIEYEERA
jgi:hypothetical protein